MRIVGGFVGWQSRPSAPWIPAFAGVTKGGRNHRERPARQEPSIFLPIIEELQEIREQQSRSGCTEFENSKGVRASFGKETARFTS